MTQPFESIVRPFAEPTFAQPVPVVTQGQVGVPLVVLKFGLSGRGKVLQGSYSITRTYYMTKQYVEKRSN